MVQKEYMYYANQPAALAITAGTPAVYYYHVDHLGTPQMMTDQAQAIAWSGNYEVFGELAVDVSTVDNALRFPGQYFDQETQLHYNYFRDYYPGLGRYIESDPIGIEDGVNTYAYVYANPLVNIDPSGEAGRAVVAIPIALCIRFPRMCKKLLQCAKNPQKCKKECKKLRSNVHGICDVKGASCKGGDSCGVMAVKKKIHQTCKTVRKAITSICFGGKQDKGHERAEKIVQDRINNCNSLRKKECCS